MCFSFSASAFALENKNEVVEFPKAISDEELAEILKTAQPVETPILNSSQLNQKTPRERTGYVVYNPKTKETQFENFSFEPSRSLGQSVPQYVPNKAINGNSRAVTIPGMAMISDTTQSPWCSTVLLVIHTPVGTKLGSGFMIGPNTVATVGHNVYQQQWGGFAYNIVVVPASNGVQQPYGSYLTEDYTCGGNWYNYEDNQDDWAIIRLPSNVGYATGYLGLRWQSDSYNGRFVYSVGYPELDDDNMYRATGNVISSSARTLTGNWSSMQGMSGGPLHSNYSDTGYTAIGFNRGGGQNGSYADAMRIDEWIYNLFILYRNQANIEVE